jgi:hypothetical protein
MEKNRGLWLISLVCIAAILVTGCTSSGSNPADMTTPSPTTTPAVGGPSPSSPGTSGSFPGVLQSGESNIILNETFSLIAGDRKSAKIYSFKELGLEFLKPNDTFIISIDSVKPINFLVTDATGKGNFMGVSPKWEKQPLSKTTNTSMWGYSYPGIWYALKADEIYHKDLLLKIDRAGSYHIIFDPQNIVEQVSELGVWQITHKNFNTHVRILQIVDPQSGDILPTSPYIIEDTSAIYSAYRDGYKEYPLDDYGFNYLNPGETFKLSIDAEKPVNVFVLEMHDEKIFDTIKPVYELQPEKGDKGSQYGYTYAGIAPLVKEDKVIKKDITFTVKKTGKYFIVIDQRFADPYAKDISFFKAGVKLSKI